MESGLEIICRVFWIDRFGAIDARLGDGIMRGDSFVADGNCSVIIIGSVEQHLFKLNLLRLCWTWFSTSFIIFTNLIVISLLLGLKFISLLFSLQNILFFININFDRSRNMIIGKRIG